MTHEDLGARDERVREAGVDLNLFFLSGTPYDLIIRRPRIPQNIVALSDYAERPIRSAFHSMGILYFEGLDPDRGLFVGIRVVPANGGDAEIHIYDYVESAEAFIDRILVELQAPGPE